MNFLTVLFQRTPVTLSHRRALVGLFGAFVLALLVVSHMVALTLFLWEAIARPSMVVTLVFLWTVSAIALFLLARYASRLSGVICNWRPRDQ